MRHPFAENALRVVDFLEPRNLAHQVQPECFDGKDCVVELARNVCVALGGFGVSENHGVRAVFTESRKIFDVFVGEGIKIPDDDGRKRGTQCFCDFGSVVA